MSVFFLSLLLKVQLLFGCGLGDVVYGQIRALKLAL